LLFSTKNILKRIIFLQARSTMPLKLFYGRSRRWRDRARFLTFTAIHAVFF
jgi:hypothetical protein